jgi:hypothetical protein
MATKTEDFKGKTRKFMRKLMWSLVLVGLLASMFFYIYRTWTVSEGSRNGTLLRISKDGAIFKTYEGQLDAGGSQILSQHSIWNFSIKNAEVYQRLQQFEGQNVVLHYRELVDPFPWQAKTDFVVYRVEQMGK